MFAFKYAIKSHWLLAFNLLLRRSDWQIQSSELLALSSRNLYDPKNIFRSG